MQRDDRDDASWQLWAVIALNCLVLASLADVQVWKYLWLFASGSSTWQSMKAAWGRRNANRS